MKAEGVRVTHQVALLCELVLDIGDDGIALIKLHTTTAINAHGIASQRPTNMSECAVNWHAPTLGSMHRGMVERSRPSTTLRHRTCRV